MLGFLLVGLLGVALVVNIVDDDDDATESDDQVNGTDENNTIDTGGGDDTVFAGGGNDLVDTGTGDDRAFGGADNDTLLGGLGHDRMFGDGGADRLGIGVHGEEPCADAAHGPDCTCDSVGDVEELHVQENAVAGAGDVGRKAEPAGQNELEADLVDTDRTLGSADQRFGFCNGWHIKRQDETLVGGKGRISGREVGHVDFLCKPA